MRDYGKVYSTFWTSETTRGLSDRGRLLALYLLSGPHSNMIGCFRLPDGYVCEDLGWSPRTVSEGFGELFRNGFATRDERSKWVLIHNFLKFNPVENPNQGKSAVRLFAQVPDSFAAKPLLAQSLREQDGKIPPSELERFGNGSETVSKPGAGTGAGEEQENPPNPPSGGNDPPGRKSSDPGADAVPIPPDLDTPDFRAAWADWLADRAARKKRVTSRAAKQQLAGLAAFGPGWAVARVRKAIANGWTGLVFDDDTPPAPKQPPAPKAPNRMVYDPPPAAPMTFAKDAPCAP